MFKRLTLALLVTASCGADPADVQLPSLDPPVGSSRFGIFEARVPCTDCQRTKVRLTLHRNSMTQAPTTYVLERIEVGKGNDRLVTRGTWSMPSKMDGCNSVVVLSGSPEEFTRYLLLSDKLLLLLDGTMNPRVGNAEHSFTLSRTE